MALAEFGWFVAYLLIALALLRVTEAWLAHNGHNTAASGIGWFVGV